MEDVSEIALPRGEPLPQFAEEEVVFSDLLFFFVCFKSSFLCKIVLVSWNSLC